LRAINGLFRDAVKALTHRDDDAPEPKPRKSGETEGGFRRLARNVDVRRSFKARATITSRYITIGPEAATATAASALAMLIELNNGSGDDFGEEFATGQDWIVPRL
jgi:hypothetical protein